MFKITRVTAAIALTVSIGTTASTVAPAFAKARTHVCYINGYKQYCHVHRNYLYDAYPYMGFYHDNYNYNYNHNFPRFFSNQPSRIVNINGNPVRAYYSRH